MVIIGSQEDPVMTVQPARTKKRRDDIMNTCLECGKPLRIVSASVDQIV